MATIERENALELFGQIVSIAVSAGVQPADKQKLVRTLEEVWIPGLREKRDSDNTKENEELIKLSKQVFRVSMRGGEAVGGFTDKKKPQRS